MHKKISYIIPSYNESNNIENVYDALKEVISLNKYDYEIIYVDNSSSDNSREIYESLNNKDKKVKSIIYSRNFGYQNALLGGIFYSIGDAVVCIDGDLQDPPELINEFIREWENGYDVVYGIRKKRKDSIIRKTFYSLYYILLNKISDVSMPKDAGDFCLMDKKVVTVIKSIKEYYVFLRGLRYWIGFKHKGIPYTRNKRKKGYSKFNFFSYIEIAWQGICDYSLFPIRVIFYFSLILLPITSLAIIFYIILNVLGKINVRGFTTIVVLMLFLSQIIIIFLSFIAEYVGRIYYETKRRPRYIIDKVIE